MLWHPVCIGQGAKTLETPLYIITFMTVLTKADNLQPCESSVHVAADD